MIENEKLQKNLKGHQKENDRLMQEIQELKATQRKNLMEIDYLKAQLASNVYYIKEMYYLLFMFIHLIAFKIINNNRKLLIL